MTTNSQFIKNNVKATVRAVLLLVLGASILAFGLYNVHEQNAITEGGVLGLTLLLHHHFGITPGITGILIDGLCYLLGFKLLGRRFLLCACTASAAFSVSYNLFEHFGYLLPSMVDTPLLSAVVGSLFVGVGVGITVRVGGACGGDDAIALILNRVCHLRISLCYLFTDLTVLLLSLTYIPFTKIIYSIVTVTLSSLLIDFVKSVGKKEKKKAAT